MSIITKATKYKILEWTIDSIFNGIERNFIKPSGFITIRDIRVGMRFKEIIRNFPNYVKSSMYYHKNCKILEYLNPHPDGGIYIRFSHSPEILRNNIIGEVINVAASNRFEDFEFDRCYTFIPY